MQILVYCYDKSNKHNLTQDLKYNFGETITNEMFFTWMAESAKAANWFLVKMNS